MAIVLTKAQLAYDNLCYRDSRSNDYYNSNSPDEPPLARDDVNCACDACFYGKDKLAQAMLELIDEVEELKHYFRSSEAALLGEL